MAIGAASALVLGLSFAAADLAIAQEADEIEEIVVTGSRIRRNPSNEPVDWTRNRFTGSLAFRWTDEMLLDSGSRLDSVTYTDIRVSYTPDWQDDALTVSIGFNNLLDEDPPVCDACGVISMSPVSDDLPGRVGYIRATYQQ